MHNNFNARELTKAGFTRVASEDFSDDGTRFTMYEYAGIKVSLAHLRNDGLVFLSARGEGNYEEISLLPSYKGLDEFNCVNEDEVDVEKLKANIEAFNKDKANMSAIVTPIKMERKAKWDEYMRLIAEYDWAVEGFSAPAGTEISRETATEIRSNLVKLAGEIRL